MKFFATLLAINYAQASLVNATNFDWLVEGVKGYYDGYESAFYKTSRSSHMKDCLDKTTVENMLLFEETITNPMSLMNKTI